MTTALYEEIRDDIAAELVAEGLVYDAVLFTDPVQAIVGGRPTGPITWTETPVQGFVGSYSQGYRTQFGIPDSDVKIVILQKGIAVTPKVDSQILIRGARYKPAGAIGAITQDPAQATWSIRARPV